MIAVPSALYDPRTGAVVDQLELAPADELAAVARRSAEAFAGWAATPLARRCEIVAELARLLASESADLVPRFCLETGKTAAEATAELDRAVQTLHWAAAAAPRVCADVELTEPDGLRRQVTVDPSGPVLAIVPSNFPAVVLARKLGPALVMGCPVVVKAPETAPAVSIAVAALAAKAGLPDGVLQTVFTDAHGSSLLVGRPEFRVVSFTGSTRTGRLVAAAAVSTLAQCVLELGGHAPAVVTADADLAGAVAALVANKFATAGQSCAAVSRVLIDERVAGEFLDRFVAATPAMDFEPSEAGHLATLGPLHTAGRQAEVHALVTEAVAAGARLHCGGQLPGTGYYYPATVLSEVPATARVWTEEPFGPVLPVRTFAGVDQAIALANDSDYGLGAFVFDAPDRARALARRLNVGRVSINCATGADPQSPLGGRADSGFGYEGGDQGLLAFGRLKVLHELGSDR